MIYALVPLLQDGEGHHGLKTFHRGDIISGHYTPEALRWLIKHDQASDQRPDDATPVYSLIDHLTYHGPGAPAGCRFMRGDRIDGILPGPLAREVVARGEASYDDPAEA